MAPLPPIDQLLAIFPHSFFLDPVLPLGPLNFINKITRTKLGYSQDCKVVVHEHGVSPVIINSIYR